MCTFSLRLGGSKSFKYVVHVERGQNSCVTFQSYTGTVKINLRLQKNYIFEKTKQKNVNIFDRFSENR